MKGSTPLQDRAWGCAVGAAVGDALGMPLEFGPRRPSTMLVQEMTAGRLPAGTFTDDTEMALALGESLLAHRPLDADDLARRFGLWLGSSPPDVGNHTRSVLSLIAAGLPWEEAVRTVQARRPDSAGNGSVMRCWPVALAHPPNPSAPGDECAALLQESRLQSRVTHPHPDCEAGSAFINATIYALLQGTAPAKAVAWAQDAAMVPEPLRSVITAAPRLPREALANSGWVQHTIESAVWGLLTTASFEEAVIQVVNLGRDADTAGAVVGALAGAAYGFSQIPERWRRDLRGEWPPRSGRVWRVEEFVALADRLIEGGPR